MTGEPNSADHLTPLDLLRAEIDAADKILLPAFIRRMQTALRVADCKFETGTPVSRPGREQAILESIRESVPPELASDAVRLYRTILAVSCSRQRIRIIALRPPRRFVLCGVKHCGKTFLGQALAEALNVPFFDTDDLLKEAAGKPVRSLYREVGEKRFRELEAEVIRKFTATAPGRAVVALGGGAAVNPVLTADDLHRLGLVVWLDVPVSTAFERMLREGLPPVLADCADPAAEFDRICDERRPKYQAIADAILPLPEVIPAECAIDELLALLESKGASK